MRRRALVVILVLACGLWPVHTLEVHAAGDGSLLLRTPLPASGRFEIRYTHSWDKTPVWEIFAVDEKGNLVLVEEDYLWMGAGLDASPGADFDFSGERVRVLRERVIGKLRLAVGTVAGHRLVLDGRELPFTRFAEPGTKVILQTRLVPWLASYGPVLSPCRRW